MKFIFWTSLILIFYTYIGYPALLFLVSLFFERPVKKRRCEPRVSIILSAFNEEGYIERKLLNLLELDYSPEKLEILVGSDGCSDKTDEILTRFHSQRVRFFRFVKNLGKPHVLKALVAEANGSILVFTDARQEFDRQAIRALVANFEDSEVGCVSGELFFKTASDEKLESVGKGMGAYWNYEKFLRKKESEIGSTLGATGAIYAIRKSLFTELPPDILVDDMFIPLAIVRKGYRSVFEEEARAFDRVSHQGTEEVRRKIRTLAGNYQIFSHFPELFAPFKSPVAWQIFSHKLLRLIVPFSLIALLVSNFFLLSNPLYAFSFISQLLFYSSARILAIPYTFCLLNFCALAGLFKYLTRTQDVAWEKAYA